MPSVQSIPSARASLRRPMRGGARTPRCRGAGTIHFRPDGLSASGGGGGVSRCVAVTGVGTPGARVYPFSHAFDGGRSDRRGSSCYVRLRGNESLSHHHRWPSGICGLSRLSAPCSGFSTIRRAVSHRSVGGSRRAKSGGDVLRGILLAESHCPGASSNVEIAALRLLYALPPEVHGFRAPLAATRTTSSTTSERLACSIRITSTSPYRRSAWQDRRRATSSVRNAGALS